MLLARSVLYLPASNPRAIEKARSLPCDVAILDLEDAVAPEMKVQARQAAVQAVRDGGFAPRLGVRINGLDTEWGVDDLAALADAAPAFVVLPKVESAQTLCDAAVRLPSGVDVWAMIETPAGVLNLAGIASASLPLTGLMLGVNDLAQGLGCVLDQARSPIQPWMVALVAAARANGLLAIDGVMNTTSDGSRLAAECAQGRAFGFDGKSLIHPDQIAAANAAFAPSKTEVAQARAVVAAFDAPEAAGKGAIRLDGRMVERLHLDAAHRLLARHAACSTAAADAPI